MESPSYWHRVTKEIKFAQTDEGKTHWNTVQALRKSAKSYLDELTAEKKKLDDMVAGGTDDVEHVKSQVETWKSQHQQKLIDLDLRSINDIDSIKTTVKMFDDEIDRITKDIDGFDRQYASVIKENETRITEQAQRTEADIAKEEAKIEKYTEETKPLIEQLLKTKDKTSPEALLLQNQIKEITDKITSLKKTPLNIQQYQPIIDGFDAYEKLGKQVKAGNTKIKPSSKDVDIVRVELVDYLSKHYDIEIPEDISLKDLSKVISDLKKSHKISEGLINKSTKGIISKNLDSKISDVPLNSTLDDLYEIETNAKSNLDYVVNKYNEIKKMTKGETINLTSHKIKLVEAISTHLGQSRGFMDVYTADYALKPIIDMMREGESSSNILKFIENNIDNYNGKSHEIYTMVANQVQYGRFNTWEEYYNHTMEGVLFKVNNGVELNADDLKIQAVVYQKYIKRKALIQKYKPMSMSELKEEKTRLANMEMDGVRREVKDTSNSTENKVKRTGVEEAHNRSIVNESALNDVTLDEMLNKGVIDEIDKNKLIGISKRIQKFKDTIQKLTDSNMEAPNKLSADLIAEQKKYEELLTQINDKSLNKTGKDLRFQKMYDDALTNYFEKLDDGKIRKDRVVEFDEVDMSDFRGFIYDRFIMKGNKGEALTTNQIEIVDKMVAEAGDILKNGFKRNYDELSEPQKNFLSALCTKGANWQTVMDKKIIKEIQERYLIDRDIHVRNVLRVGGFVDSTKQVDCKVVNIMLNADGVTVYHLRTPEGKKH